MKNVFYSVMISSALFACTLSPNETSNFLNTEVAEKELKKVDYNLDTDKTSIIWERFLDQKATEKKVKLFGSYVDVKMGPVTMNMNGNVVAKSGDLSLTGSEPTSGQVIFNMATFKFAEEKGEGLFNVKDFPESELKFLSFSKLENDSLNNYMAKATVTIQEKTVDYDLPLQFNKGGTSGASIQSTFVINTLDFPLRENAKKEEVNKDEITVSLDLLFNTK